MGDSPPVVRLLQEFIAIPSVNPEYDAASPGEPAMADAVEERCRKAGLEVWRQDVLPGRQNVIAELRVPGATRRLILESHMDTVSLSPMNERALRPELRDGRIYGRGACDDKGSLAAMMVAMETLVARRKELKANVMLVAAADEEHFFRGVLTFVKSGIPADGAVVGEPTDLRVIVAHRGVMRFRIKTFGRSTHSSMPEQGVNAIDAMRPILDGLSQLHQRLQSRRHPLIAPPTCTVNVIHGGISVHIVAPECVIEVDRRVNPGETAQAVLAEIDQVLAQVRQAHPSLKMERQDPYVVTPTLETPIDAEIVNAIRAACRSVGLGDEPGGVTYGSDASKFWGYAKIPSVVLGPGSITHAHSADEFVPVEELSRAVDIYVRTALNF